MKIRSADCNVWTPPRVLSGAGYRCHVRWSAGARHRTLGPEVRHIRILYGLALCVRPKDDKATTELLVVAQRAWVAFRDAECAFSASGVSGGTAHGMIPAICLDKLTGKRIDDFKDYLKCQEGALDCPIPAKQSFGFQMAGQRRTVRRWIGPSRLGVVKEVNQIAVA